MKDRFSTHSDQYARYRPSYPEKLVAYVAGKCPEHERAWDAGTGSGQFVSKLHGYFKELFATDISYEQLRHAPQIPNITYHIQPSERTSFADESFDLVSVAQALHWFDLDKFYIEVNRVLKPNGVFAAIGYNLCIVPGVNEVLQEFYGSEIDAYWDPERRIVEDEYRSIPFPFDEKERKDFAYEHAWNLDDLLGYLKTWSAVKKYEADRRENPVDLWKETFADAWGSTPVKPVITPLFVRLGRRAG